MGIRRRLGAVFVFVVFAAEGILFATPDAFAQETCSRLATVPASAGAIGRLTQVRGNVQMSQAGGYAGVGPEAASAPVMMRAPEYNSRRKSRLPTVKNTCKRLT